MAADSKTIPPPEGNSGRSLEDKRASRPTQRQSAASLPPALAIGSDANDGKDRNDSPAPSASDAAAESTAAQPRFWTRWIHWLPQRLNPNQLPAMLVSLIFHVALLLVLALLTLTRPLGQAPSSDFELVNVAAERETLPTPIQLAAGNQAPPSPTPNEEPPPDLPTTTSTQPADARLVQMLQEMPTAAAQSSMANELEQMLQATSNNLSAAFAASGIEGRQAEQRRDLALARGGSLESEAAVERALEWLAAHQLPSGGWSLVHSGGPCNGRCSHDGVQDRFDPAATGLSLLAFLGAGYTHKEGKYRETVRKGVYFLLQVMEETAQGGSFLYQCDRGMYNHGIAAFAMCEAYQLTQDNDLKEPAQKAVAFIVAAQNYQGGWGYLPKQPGDLTLSGWQVMALKSAFAAGLDVPPSTILRVDSFLDSQTDSGVFYGYGKPGRSATCTAIGLLNRLFRGMPHTDPRILDGAQFFTKLGPASDDVYYNYYASLFLFHVGQPFWEEWNTRVRDHLIGTQASSGHEAGSWYFENAYGREGGRLYTTAMAAMTLEVYYRFSPIYQQADVKFEL